MKIFFSILICLIIGGCATSYQNKSLTGGYSETRLQDNMFTVYFRGNGYCSDERAQDFLMLRCADLTLENGFKFFIISDSSTNDKTLYYNSSSVTHTQGTINSIGNTSYGNFTSQQSPGLIIPIKKHRCSCTIVCFKEKHSENEILFDAKFLSNSIRQKYRI